MEQNGRTSTPHIVIVYGPTGVGKTDFALALGKRVPAEIINMDMGQFYTPLSIGTAKPDWRSMPVAHHLFDIIHEPINYTVSAYRVACLALIEDIWRRGKMPILVGGSGFYLKSLFFPPRMDFISSTTDLAGDQVMQGADLSPWEQLYSCDPERAMAIDKNDTYRIDRALAIWRKTGMKPSQYIPEFNSDISAHIIFLGRDRKQLYERIDQRVESMINAGWQDEVAQLCNTPWEAFIKNKKLIGYNELCDYAHGEIGSLAKAIARIQQRTRHYAKRQYTFWRMLAKQISCYDNARITMESVNVTCTDFDHYIEQLIQRLPFIQ